MKRTNAHQKTVLSFGHEWKKHDQSGVPEKELRSVAERYFHIFPFRELPSDAEGFDMGCGSGRWAKFLAPKVGRLHCIDPAEEALEVAKKNLADHENISFHLATTESTRLVDGSQDFGYSLGVLHHVPDTQKALIDCVRLLKPGAPLLVYLYYKLDGRPLWYKGVWWASDVARRVISALPMAARSAVTDLIAAVVYWPLSRLASLCQHLGIPYHVIPLAFYKDSSFATLRTDSRDRFGTPLEKRFALSEILELFDRAGLQNAEVYDGPPFWVLVGRKG